MSNINDLKLALTDLKRVQSNINRYTSSTPNWSGAAKTSFLKLLNEVSANNSYSIDKVVSKLQTLINDAERSKK